MTRDTRLMHPDALNEVVDRALAITNGIEDAPPCWFGNRVEDLRCGRHAYNIHGYVYMRNRIGAYRSTFKAYVSDVVVAKVSASWQQLWPVVQAEQWDRDPLL